MGIFEELERIDGAVARAPEGGGGADRHRLVWGAVALAGIGLVGVLGAAGEPLLATLAAVVATGSAFLAGRGRATGRSAGGSSRTGQPWDRRP